MLIKKWQSFSFLDSMFLFLSDLNIFILAVGCFTDILSHVYLDWRWKQNTHSWSEVQNHPGVQKHILTVQAYLDYHFLSSEIWNVCNPEIEMLWKVKSKLIFDTDSHSKHLTDRKFTWDSWISFDLLQWCLVCVLDLILSEESI